MRTAEFDRDVMNVNQRVLRAIAGALRAFDFEAIAAELEFIAATLTPQPDKED